MQFWIANTNFLQQERGKNGHPNLGPRQNILSALFYTGIYWYYYDSNLYPNLYQCGSLVIVWYVASASSPHYLALQFDGHLVLCDLNSGTYQNCSVNFTILVRTRNVPCKQF